MLTLSGHTGPVRALAYSPDGRLLASGGADRTVRIWDMAERRERDSPFLHANAVIGLAFAPDGNVVASIGLDRQLRLWDVANVREGTTVPPQTTVPTAVAFFPDGKSLATSGGMITCLAVSPDGKTVAAGSAEPSDFKRGVVRVWTSDGIVRNSATLDLTDMGRWSAIYPGQPRHDELGGGVRVVKLWEPYSDRRLPALQHPEGVRAVAFSPTGTMLATGAGNTVRLWDPAAGRELATLKRHANDVTALVFTPDGRGLFSGSADRSVRLWDTASGRLRDSYRWPTGKVSAVAVSPDGLTAAAAGEMPDIVVWDVEGA
jgi:WD40 repeat protein